MTSKPTHSVSNSYPTWRKSAPILGQVRTHFGPNPCPCSLKSAPISGRIRTHFGPHPCPFLFKSAPSLVQTRTQSGRNPDPPLLTERKRPSHPLLTERRTGACHLFGLKTNLSRRISLEKDKNSHGKQPKTHVDLLPINPS